MNSSTISSLNWSVNDVINKDNCFNLNKPFNLNSETNKENIELNMNYLKTYDTNRIDDKK